MGQIFKLVQKIFFGQETKWWVKTSQKSFVSKILYAPQAEKWRLKIFLEAFSETTARFAKTQSNSRDHILWNFEILRPLVTVKLLILPTRAHFQLEIPNSSLHNKLERQISLDTLYDVCWYTYLQPIAQSSHYLMWLKIFI